MSFKTTFYTKDKDMQRYLDILINKSVVDVPSHIAQDIGRIKAIRKIRKIDDSKNPLIIIGKDRLQDRSIIKIREPFKIIKVGNKYRFSL